MISAQLVLYLLAVVVFIIGALDMTRFGAVRCISLAMGLVVLAQIVR